MNRRIARITAQAALLVTISASGLLLGSHVPVAAQSATQAATQDTTSQCAPAQQFSLFNLNTGTPEQFLTIPAMNNRMVREYQEYRPYTSILQFRQEISKYVGAEQTSAWEKYIYVPIQVDTADAETLKQIPGVTDEIAAQLIEARPFNSNAAFLTKLASLLTADQTAFAKNYLAPDTNATPEATLSATSVATIAATAAATPCATEAATQ